MPPLEIDHIFESWNYMTEVDRCLVTARLIYMISKQYRIATILLFVGVAVAVGYGVTSSPYALVLGLFIGIILGVVAVWR